MDRLTLAGTLLKHLGHEPSDLPLHLFTDKEKDYPLGDLDDRVLAHYNEDTLFSLKTVRFLKDFSRFGAGVNIDTTNKSFLRTAELFKQMGIKNYYYHLQLNNPLLKGVDAWDENLSDELKFMVMAEANSNIWFILRELIQIDGRRFIGNRAVLSFIWCCLNHLNTLILLPRQSGKESWNSSVVKIPGGWKYLGDIKPGDTVIAPDGKHTAVNAVYPQGKKPVYSIKFQDGRKHEAGPEHLWKVFDPEAGTWSVITTLDALDRHEELKEKGMRISVPHAVAEDGPELDFLISPYLFGKRMASQEIVHENRIRPTRQDRYLRQFNLMDKKPEQFYIPERYRFNSNKSQRLEVLQGLLDRVGTINSDGSVNCKVFSKVLAEHIQYLARSLGMLGTIQDIVTDVEDMSWEYNVTINAEDTSILFTDEEKQTQAHLAQENGSTWTGMVDFESFRLMEERKECTCIEVDHPDHLFVTDDFIVTHNTVGMQVMIFILQYIVGRGYKSGLITLASNNRQQFVNAVKKIRSGAPDYLISMSYKDKDSGNIMTYQGHGVENNNIFEIRVPSGGADGAENVARGSTFGSLLLDEPAWIKWIENIVSGSGPATLTEQRNMLEKGMPWFNAQATTPNSVLKPEGRYMYEEYLSSTPWKENFFDCFSESHLFATVIKNSPKPTTFPKVTIQYNHLQLGFGENWVLETMDKLKLSWSKAKIDLLMMWTEEGQNKIFDDKTRELLNACKVEHLRFQEVDKTELFFDWFISKSELENFIDDETEFGLIGVDTSDAKGEKNDACTITLRRAKTGEVLGTGRYSLAFLGDVRDVILHLLVNIPNSLLIIERNRAQQIIDDLLLMLPPLGIDPFKRIYNEIYQYPVKYATDFRDVTNTKFPSRTKEFYLRYKAKFGFQTNGASRGILYGLVFEAVLNTGSGIKYGLLIDELVGLEQGSGGRIDHAVKGHDDIVISWLLSYWFIKLGYNKSLYGIPSNACLTEIKTLAESAGQSKYTQAQILEFAKIREKIAELTKKLLNCESDLIAPRIEEDIRKLTRLLPGELKRLITIDEVIDNARKERLKRRLEQKRRYQLGYR